MIIQGRFNGPPDSGNGGYVAGRLAVECGAEAVREGVTVVLRDPPPLDVRLTVARDGERLLLLDGDRLIAEALPGKVEYDPVPPVSPEEAAAASEEFPGRHGDTPFEHCFVCGPFRPDGLRLAPGPVAPDTTAAPWTPGPELPPSPELVWSALDCPGGWASGMIERPALLGTMTARVHDVPAVGEPCVALGRLHRRDGRKAFTSTALYGADSRLLAHAAQVWIAFPS